MTHFILTKIYILIGLFYFEGALINPNYREHNIKIFIYLKILQVAGARKDVGDRPCCSVKNVIDRALARTALLSWSEELDCQAHQLRGDNGKTLYTCMAEVDNSREWRRQRETPGIDEATDHGFE